MADESPRTRAARDAAERALVRVVHHYGSRPGFVLLGGLVPDLLCSASARRHAGTTDVDVQVDLEIAAGAVNTSRLEQVLRNAEFVPDGQSTWRWMTTETTPRTVIRFELLADLDTEPRQRSALMRASLSARSTSAALASRRRTLRSVSCAPESVVSSRWRRST